MQVPSRIRLRTDLDDLRRAGRLARHAIDAVRLTDHVGLVASVLVPFLAALLDDLIVAGPLLTRGEDPLEDVDGTYVHTHAVRDAAIEVDGDVSAVDPQRRGVGFAVKSTSRDMRLSPLAVCARPVTGPSNGLYTPPLFDLSGLTEAGGLPCAADDSTAGVRNVFRLSRRGPTSWRDDRARGPARFTAADRKATDRS